jgi:hypothetical protein
MLAEITLWFILCIVIFFSIVIVGNELLTIMVDEQFRYIRLIIHYAPLQPIITHPSGPEPVARYVSWVLGENRHPAACVYFRHAGRIRYGKTKRWMRMNGEASFSLGVPAFVCHTTITYAPGIWLETFDYYIDRTAGINLNLFSVFPLDNGHTDEMKGRMSMIRQRKQQSGMGTGLSKLLPALTAAG